MRADAEANRQRLLTVAEELFARRGVEVSVAEIVAAAGVGPPTLYRHFGTKDGLIRAVGERRAEVVAAQLARALSQPSGWEGLCVAVQGSLELARNSLAVRQGSGLSLPASLERMLLSGWAELIDRAHREGSVRPDFSSTDLPFLFVAIGAAVQAAQYRPSLQDRYVALLMEGLRPGARDPLPGPPPSPRQIRSSFALNGAPPAA